MVRYSGSGYSVKGYGRYRHIITVIPEAKNNKLQPIFQNHFSNPRLSNMQLEILIKLSSKI